ncbi:PfkB family carbohydrate kinase [Variovorax paradoxus]|uniref:PfkB family carbohydrate kinase n=1 Tax=Variovorax paradoxus TaxID=34073 RepID=UPI00039B5E8D|nr:PfkB family carbohydrate kinase [Variovorax paradoxus]
MAASTPRPARVTSIGMSVLDRIMRVASFASGGSKIYASGYDEIGGGPAATAAVAVKRLGGTARLIARVGEDATGDVIRSELAGHGVDVSLMRTLRGAQSAASNVTVDDHGERQITHFIGQGLDVEADWIEASSFDGTDVVLADMGWRRGAQRALALAAAAGIPTVLDADMSVDPRAGELLGLADHVVFSEAALSRMSGLAEPADGLRWARGRVRGPYVGVTVGALGYLWLAGETLHAMPGYPVTAIDTLGAGDVFHGAYALALAEGRDVAAAARFANAAAAIKCTRASGRRGIPLRAEVDAWLVQHH